VDGNKRTALAASLVFLKLNDLLKDPGLPARNVDAWEALVLDVAASRIDREETTARLRKLLRRRKPLGGPSLLGARQLADRATDRVLDALEEHQLQPGSSIGRARPRDPSRCVSGSSRW
jgi:hypothetical protein